MALLFASCAYLAPRVQPLPPGTQECIGLDRAHCNELMTGVAGRPDREPGTTPVGWRVRCTTVCTRERGDAEVTITWSDGTTEMHGMGWVGDLGPPGAPGPLPTSTGS